MKKLKDIIYDFNDVLVALLIVAAAAGIIFWRLNVVMDYPKFASAYEINETPEIDIDFDDVDLNQEEIENIVNPEDEPETSDPAVNPQTETGSAVEPQPETPPVVEPQQKPEIKTFKLTVSKENKNGNWSAVGTALENAGIIPSKSEFIKRVTERGVDAKLQLGTFNFSSDMSLDEVIDELIE